MPNYCPACAEEVIESLKRLALRGDAMETKRGYWMELR